MVTLRLSLDRRIRKALPSDKKYDAYTDGYFGIGRSICFSIASIFEYPKKSSIMINFYDGFDVKSHAKTIDKFLAWIMILSLFFLLATTLLSQIIEWFGFWDS